MSDRQSESAGVVKCASDGVVVIPVELREVLGIKNKEAFLRLNDISVAKVVGDRDDVNLSDVEDTDGQS